MDVNQNNELLQLHLKSIPSNHLPVYSQQQKHQKLGTYFTPSLEFLLLNVC